MSQLKRTDLSVRAERAILVGVRLPGESDEKLDELASLTRTAGAKIVGCVVQKRTAPDSAYMVGWGKAMELHSLSKELDADIIICDCDLTPAQVRNLEKATDTKVVDRTELILDIFATHARTKQARLQVELAQLEYLQPRLRRMWTHLSRIEGGVGAKGGIGTRGPGEQQLEVDRRLISRRITRLKNELKGIERRKEREVASRKEEYTIALVGYTNSGKSSLMNQLTNAGVHVGDKLFATLDTKTSVWDLGNGRRALLSDTVGFIKKLPHHLVASFHATLEEVCKADLLLHVADISSSHLWSQTDAVASVLTELRSNDKPTIVALNKVDLLDGEPDMPVLRKRLRNFVLVSARTGAGIPQLQQKVAEILEGLEIEAVVTTDPGNAEVFSFLCRNGRVLRTSVANGVAKFHVRLEPRYLGKLRKLAQSIHVAEGAKL